MQKIVFLLFFFIPGINSFSQPEFFLYFQADNHQPFYARINSRLYSSTEYGYMIIPKLVDSVYRITIGFAKNAYPEQSFAVAITKKDRGFQLKNLGEKGWSIVDLQNMSVIVNTGLPAKPEPEFTGIRKTDAFSEMLADVVNDSAILYSAVVPKVPEAMPQKPVTAISKPAEKEKQKTDSIQTPAIAIARIPATELVKSQDTASKADSNLVATITPPKQDRPKEVIAKTKDSVAVPQLKNTDTAKTGNAASGEKAIVEKPFITKIEEKKTEEMYQATYLEQYIYNTDTIKIIIPLTDNPAIAISSPATVIEKKQEPASAPEQKNIAEEKHESAKPVMVDTAAANKRTIQITNSDCINLATDYDVDKLRVKLLNDKTIDDKLATSKKYFKSKCLSVKQIKALTELFPTDETKVRFYETSYPFISDTSNFYQLEEFIESNYYKNRFKAMIHK